MKCKIQNIKCKVYNDFITGMKNLFGKKYKCKVDQRSDLPHAVIQWSTISCRVSARWRQRPQPSTAAGTRGAAMLASREQLARWWERESLSGDWWR